jgi:hypothetical protein
MADNYSATPGSGYDFAAEDIDGVLHPRIKLQFGITGTAADVSVDDPLPVAVSGLLSAVTRTYTTSADARVATNITEAPESGKKIVLVDLIISSLVALVVTISEETSGTVFAKFFTGATSTVQFSPRGFLKCDTADKKLQVTADIAGSLAVTAIHFSEA